MAGPLKLLALANDVNCKPSITTSCLYFIFLLNLMEQRKEVETNARMDNRFQSLKNLIGIKVIIKIVTNILERVEIKLYAI